MRYPSVKPALLLLPLLFAAISSWAADDCPPPLPSKSAGLVHQYGDAQLLSAQEEAALERKLLAQNDTTSVQIVVVVHPDCCGMPAWQFASRLGESWGVGQAGTDNGVVIAIKPRRGSTPGDISIQAGRGMLQHLTAARAGLIIDKAIIPSFRSGDFYRGLDEGTTAIALVAAGKYEVVEGDRSDDLIPIVVVIVLVLLMVFLFTWIASKAEHHTNYTGRGWQHTRGSWGGRGGFGGGFGSGGGGGFGGGGGGGGFGGFGGGSFGGGGASGSW